MAIQRRATSSETRTSSFYELNGYESQRRNLNPGSEYGLSQVCDA
jgi:hypothetical protein